MARKKKPALNSSGPSYETKDEDFELTLDPYYLPEFKPEAKVEPMVEPKKPKAPKLNRVGVKLDVFLRICGKKPDQTAGFRRWALDNGLKQMDVKDWRAEFDKFLRRPV